MGLISNKFARFLLVCILFGLVKDISCQLRRACKHNQFRCSDGSKCLETEKLCNGIKDCTRGEDETGGTQWDCSKVTLSTSCNHLTEYKCRYGGCIPRDKLCDGKPDCWGANDEATDVCSGKTPRPHAPPNKVPAPTTSQRPKPQPTRPKPPAAPPAPPAPRPTNGGCPSLAGDELIGFAISCVDEYNRRVDCIQSNAPPGSKALYTCKKYYSPSDTGGYQTEITCQSNGQWTPRRKSFICTLGCGVGGAEATGFITGGVTSKKGKWPWHVALYQEDPPNSGKFVFFCGGSLISPNAILTAAHCVSRKSTSVSRDPREVRVVMGKYFRSYKRREGDEQERRVQDINLHDGYNHITYDNDIAIVWLDKPAVIGDHVRPVCLPTFNDNDVYASRHFAQLVGWGRTSNGQFKEDLQEAKIPVVLPQTCKEAHPTFATLVRGTTFCAGYRNGTSACDGDSGGGLVFPDNDGRNLWRVQGIVSAGIAKGTGGCHEGYYSVYTKVGQYLTWIHGTLDRDYRK